MNKTSQEIRDMIQLCSVEATARTISQILDILTALNERMDAMELEERVSALEVHHVSSSERKNQIQNERNYPNT